MEAKVTLYNAAGERIGDTFARRARQLVKQQRAYWLDAGETEVRFHPGMEHLKDVDEDDAGRLQSVSFGKPHGDERERAEAKLRQSAEVRVWFENLMRMLVGIYVAVNIFLMGIWFFTGRGYFWPGWVIGGWGTGLIVLNIIIKLIVVPPTDYQDRIDSEYRKLRHRAGLGEDV
ncbi:MAG: 2TM domain-containing protein [Defluviitaleaceae bacterium]|nr:2TM domain-containing protein [Defluviitaleaceae bacterium]